MVDLKKYKPNINEVMERQRRFLRMEDTGWPLLHIQVSPEQALPSPQYVTKSYIEIFERNLRKRSEVNDDLLPVLWVNLGPSMMAGFMGCPVRFTRRTSWSEPILDDYSEIDKIGFDPHNQFFVGFANLLELASMRVDNQIAVGLPDVGPGSPADLAAAIRGRERLMVDLYRHPDDAKKLMDICAKAYTRIVNLLLENVSHPYDGTTTGYLSHWMPTRIGSIFQEDIAVFLSPKKYREIVKPFDEMVINQFQDSIFHCDGSWHIIPELLRIGKLGTIQFVNPPKGPHILQVETLHSEKRNKPIMIHCMNIKLIKKAIKVFGCKGLKIVTQARSVREAKKIVADVKNFALKI